MLHRSLARSWLVVVASLPLALASASAQQQDEVWLAKSGAGARSKGSLSTISKDAVSLEISGVVRPFPVNEIARVLFASEPSELNNARNAIAQRNWSLALTELKKLDGQTFTSKYVSSDVSYYKALCQARLAMTEGGDKGAAQTALFDWVRGNPTSHHFYEAAETLGDLAVSAGDYAGAAKFYNGLAGAPWDDYQMRGNIAVGRALLAQQDYSTALKNFEAVIGSPIATPEATTQKQYALVGKGNCLVGLGQTDEGLTLLNDLINKNDPTDVVLFARTYNALGNAYLKLNRNKDALQAFLFTDLLFYTDAESHAEALYHLSKLWNDVNKSDRAVQSRNTLRERYSGSIWAAKE
jgi:tetratricopeptide (TPR) repeat protein